ncbi:MAG: hypothetical protein WA021_02740 [Minisyncoccia bacterium]
MDLYSVQILVRKPGEETPRILEIAADTSQAVRAMEIDRTKICAGYVSVKVRSSLAGAQKMQQRGLTVKKV